MFATLAGIAGAVHSSADSLPRLGSGCYRNVYDLAGGMVLKVDRYQNRYGRGEMTCAAEAALWAQVDGSPAAEYFAPVLASGDGWLVMVKADRSNLDYDLLWDLRRVLDRMGIGDMHDGNVGMVNGRMVAIDYACNSALRDGNDWGAVDEDSGCTCEDCCPPDPTPSSPSSAGGWDARIGAQDGCTCEDCEAARMYWAHWGSGRDGDCGHPTCARCIRSVSPVVSA